LEHYLGQDVWETDVARFGIDIWMTTTAVNAGMKVCQAHLGAKIHDAKDPAASLGPMFRQVVGTLFGMLSKYEANWKEVVGYRPTDFYGEPVTLDPEPVPVTLAALIGKLRAGQGEWGHVWQAVLSQENQAVLAAILAQPERSFRFTAAQWAPIVFDFAIAYNRAGVGSAAETGLDRDAIIDGMTPLYYGRTGGLVVQSAEMDNDTFEKEIVQVQARTFEELKPVLIERWRDVRREA
jgi:hypothetical protein